ncbi:hypothetical protein Ae406Ps2_3328c [Pseudonocardia sp. Ae406_Ps2]|nr:hypothetical protein Ae331Ps2_2596 [Pseudonocardia sp. Ae331_Ps2]OLM03328.1 hypothetical protein Ae406Ps2_3328c [Pseudonocardia sp. Ae406_Ps2]OLM11776.1 hypothetical protein Ae505Ps2_1901 [Pseudonocardia sp. Ae505_Ps2]OLM24893.1 hypothetical protein Ae706Ps2_3326c [Pseudonocardia sp. Ae706_Ps2]
MTVLLSWAPRAARPPAIAGPRSSPAPVGGRGHRRAAVRTHGRDGGGSLGRRLLRRPAVAQCGPDRAGRLDFGRQ